MQSLAHGQHVLVVDDVAMDGFIASCILRQEGYQVTWAKDGATAIEAVEKTDFSVVLMDVRMPGMDGLEATRQIRKLQSPHGQVPIVALSATDFTDQKEPFFKAGMNGVMSKPFNPDLLRIALSDVKQFEPARLRKHRPVLKIPPQGKTIILTKARKETELPVTVTGLELVYGQFKRSRLTMEKAFWNQLQYICLVENVSFIAFVEEAKRQRPSIALAVAIRLHIIHYFRARSSNHGK